MKARNTITAAALAASTTLATAQSLTIEDFNSSASFDGSGQVDWTVDGSSQLFTQSFFYRAAGMDDEQNISTLGLLDATITDTNPFSDDRADTLVQVFGDGSLQVETTFGLAGGTNGSGRAGLAEQIDITNTSTSTISFSFFQYVDFDLGGTTLDTGSIESGNTALQSDLDGTTSVSETVATPAPDAFQMSEYPSIADLFGNGTVDTLDGSDSVAEGNVSWAFQWNLELAAGDTFQISKNKTLAPSPGSMALLGMGGLFAARRRRA